jgi:hypothetical protein
MRPEAVTKVTTARYNGGGEICPKAVQARGKVKEGFQTAAVLTAQELCLTILEAARQFMRAPPTHNDVTTLALIRDV